jgi:hypothetical protein
MRLIFPKPWYFDSNQDAIFCMDGKSRIKIDLELVIEIIGYCGCPHFSAAFPQLSLKDYQARLTR